jgi:hypothetical protein
MATQSKIGWRSYTPLVSYILDTYTGATAVYSLRRLKSNYSGSAIRVRRSGDNTSMDIGFLANGNLNVSALTSFVGSGDGFVTTWYDQSGNAKNATQVTAVAQPKIVSAGSVIIRGGKPCVYFDGVNDTLSISNSISSPTTATLFAVAFTNGLNTSNDIIMGARGALSFRYGGTGTSVNYMCITRAESVDYVYGIIPSNKNTLGVFYSSPTRTTLYSNGVWRGNGTSPGSLSTPISYIGSSGDGQWFQDGIQELVFYSNDQLADRTLIENDINNYYSLWTQPTSISTNGLIVNLDPSSVESYPGAGNNWFNLTGTQSLATLYNGPILGTANDGSIRFDGVNDYSSIPVNLSPYSQVTIEVWYKVNNNSSGIIFEHSSNWNTNSAGFGLAVNASGCLYDATYMHTNHKDGSDARNYLFTSGASWSCHTNVFSRVSDPTGRLAYVNGQLVPFISTNSCGGGWSTSTATGNTTAFRNDNMFLMSRAGQSFVNGNIGLIRIYGRKLTATEILQNYNATKSRFGL